MTQLIMVQDEPRGPSQLIEVPVPASVVQRVNFPDVQQLRSMANQIIIVKAIRLITNEVLTNGPITGLVNATPAELAKISLVIYCEGWEKAQYLPINTLNDTALPGGVNPHRYQSTKFDNWQNVDWSKTYLQYSNGTSSSGAAYCVMLDVQYVKLDSQGKPIIGPS